MPLIELSAYIEAMNVDIKIVAGFTGWNVAHLEWFNSSELTR